MKLDDYFYIGYITKTKGLKGEVQIFFEYPKPNELSLKTLFIEIDSKLIPHFINSFKLQNNQTGLFLFENFDSIEKAEKLVRKKIYMSNKEKPKRNKEQFLLTDLKGFTLYAEPYGELGMLTDVRQYPQQYIATFWYKKKEIMLPLNDQFIEQIDLENQRVYASLPNGLIEIYLEE